MFHPRSWGRSGEFLLHEQSRVTYSRPFCMIRKAGSSLNQHCGHPTCIVQRHRPSSCFVFNSILVRWTLYLKWTRVIKRIVDFLYTALRVHFKIESPHQYTVEYEATGRSVPLYDAIGMFAVLNKSCWLSSSYRRGDYRTPASSRAGETRRYDPKCKLVLYYNDR